MKASSYFTDGEIETALALASSLLEDKKILEELSVEFDAGDRFVLLKDKIDLYFSDMKNEASQE